MSSRAHFFRIASALSFAALLTGGAAGCGQRTDPSPTLGRSVHALSADLVISAVYGGGSGSGAIYKHDYVELFNRGTTAVSLAGKSLQYSRADVANWTVMPLPGDTIDPGKYYLIRVFSPTTLAGADLPTPDHVETSGDGGTGVNYGTTSGLVAIVEGTTPLTCGFDAGACTSSSIVDFLGYGAGDPVRPPTVYEGSGGAPQGSSTKAVMRKGNGCIETDDNAADFEAVTIATTGPSARNSATAAFSCASLDAGADAADDASDAADGASDASDDASDTGSAEDATADASDDTGPTPADTGSSTDTGTTPADTGAPATDTGADTGTPPVQEEVLEDDGCSFRPARASAGVPFAAPVVLGALGALLRRRRRN